MGAGVHVAMIVMHLSTFLRIRILGALMESVVTVTPVSWVPPNLSRTLLMAARPPQLRRRWLHR
eukprot:1892238-Pyramimonas_sp.AAC.1